MVSGRAQNRKLFRWLVAIAVLSLPVVITLLLVGQNGASPGIYTGIRVTALLAYFYAFEAVLASGLIRRLVKLYRQPFEKLHHVVALTALGLMILHGLLNVINSGTLTDLLPVFGSWPRFFEQGGRVALWLFVIAGAAARFRKLIGNPWRIVHALTLIAFVLASVHAWLIGSDTYSIAARIVIGAMLAVAAGVAVSRRVGKKRR